MALLFVRQLGIGLAIGLVVGVAAVWALRRVTLATAGLYPVATLAVAALAFGGADALHGSGFLAVYLAGLALGTAGIPAQQTVTSFHQGLAWVGQVAMFVSLGPARLPEPPRRRRRARDRARARARVRLAPGRGRGVHPADALHVARARSCSRGPACAAPCPSSSPPSRSSTGSSGQHAALRRRLLRRAALDAHPGHDVRAAGPRAGRDHRRARPAAPAGRGGDDQAAGRRGARVPGRRRRRGGRRARARPRAPARGGGQRHRARRRGDPAARLDRPARRRPPARPAALGALARRAPHRRALAQGADRAAAAAGAADGGAPAHLHRRAVRRRSR